MLLRYRWEKNCQQKEERKGKGRKRCTHAIWETSSILDQRKMARCDEKAREENANCWRSSIVVVFACRFLIRYQTFFYIPFTLYSLLEGPRRRYDSTRELYFLINGLHQGSRSWVFDDSSDGGKKKKGTRVCHNDVQFEQWRHAECTARNKWRTSSLDQWIELATKKIEQLPSVFIQTRSRFKDSVKSVIFYS